MRIIGSAAFGVLIALLGYHFLPTVFWDHGPYVFTSDRLEGAIVAGAYSSIACFGLSGFFDSTSDFRAIALWLALAAAGAAWAILQLTPYGR